MLKSLRIKNFQSHKDTMLEFHPGVNVIQGKSTTGKTAIIRALSLLANNRPSGFRYHSNFSDENTQITLEVPEGAIIFDKSKTKSKYIVDGEEYSGFGMDMPDVVKEKLNLSELSISRQLDPHFLITSAPGQVAKVLNKVTHIDEVDDWVSNLTKEINSNNKEISMLRNQCTEIDTQLKDYEDIDNADTGLNSIEKLYLVLEQVKSKHNLLTSVYNNLMSVDNMIIKNEKNLTVDIELAELEELLDTRKEAKQTLIGLKEFVDLDQQINALELTNEAGQVLDKIIKLVNGLDLLLKEIRLTGGVLKDITALAEDIQTASLIYKRRKKDYSDTLISLNTCPLCFSKIDSSVVEAIIKEL